MTRLVNIDEAKKQLQDLLALASEGNEVIITDKGKLLARLVPIAAAQGKKRIAGLNRGAVSLSEDFDAPLSDEFWLGQE